MNVKIVIQLLIFLVLVIFIFFFIKNTFFNTSQNIIDLDLEKENKITQLDTNQNLSNLIENLSYEIKLINGICKIYEDDYIEIRNLTNLDFKTFLNQDNNNFDDIIIDFNKIFLNSGIFFNIKSDAKLNIRLIHDTSDNFTIFQNNFVNFKKNAKLN